jgi:TusA-related sulfurtransferase/peroxiredoxin family protein
MTATATATATVVDCRGQRCPAPILATAKAARALGGSGGGLLEIAADDDAFPLDIRSWCRSAGAELVQLRTEGVVHTAVVRVTSRAAQPTAAATPPPPPPRIVAAPAAEVAAPASPSPVAALVVELAEVFDCRGQRCPEPILGLARRARALGGGATLEMLADDPAFELDLRSWCRSAGAKLLSLEPEGKVLRARIQLAGGNGKAAAAPVSAPAPTDAFDIAPTPVPALMTPTSPVVSIEGLAPADRIPRLAMLLAALPGGSNVTVVADDPELSVELVQWSATAGHRLLSLEARDRLRVELQLAAPPPSLALVPVGDTGLVPELEAPQCTLLVLHNDREALLAALLVAVGAAAQGMSVMMFFTFWGLNLLRGENPNVPPEKVSWAQRMFKWMMPKGPAKQKLGKLDMAGMGRSMLGSIMKRYKLMDIPELMVTAEEQGVRFVACTMSMQVMGITKHDLAPRGNLDFGGVAAFVESASRSRMSLTF